MSPLLRLLLKLTINHKGLNFLFDVVSLSIACFN